MSKRKVACFVVFGAAAVTLAGYSALAQRSQRAMFAEQAAGDFTQTPNRSAKTNRLLIQTAAASEPQPTYVVASIDPNMAYGRAPDSEVAAAPLPELESGAVPSAPTSTESKAPETKTAALPPAEKPKRLLPPPPAPAPAPPKAAGLLDDGQISGLKGRLRLTSDQAEYWPAVESALRDVAHTHLRGAKPSATGKLNIDTNSPEVQKLIWAAMPLLMRLREDQKSEVRKLARVIGLEQVASQI